MIRTSFFFWASLAVLAFVVNIASAKADCQWQVSGILEGDNVIQHCYHAPENRFVAMTFCT